MRRPRVPGRRAPVAPLPPRGGPERPRSSPVSDGWEVSLAGAIRPFGRTGEIPAVTSAARVPSPTPQATSVTPSSSSPPPSRSERRSRASRAVTGARLPRPCATPPVSLFRSSSTPTPRRDRAFSARSPDGDGSAGDRELSSLLCHRRRRCARDRDPDGPPKGDPRKATQVNSPLRSTQSLGQSETFSMARTGTFSMAIDTVQGRTPGPDRPGASLDGINRSRRSRRNAAG